MKKTLKTYNIEEKPTIMVVVIIMQEKKIRSRPQFKGRVFNTRIDDVLLPNDQVSIREVVEHIGGVCIAAQKDDGTFYLVKQFRYPHNKVFIEFPAGKKECGELPLITAKRELQEEVGVIAQKWVYLGRCVVAPAYNEEVLELYYAHDLKEVGQSLDQEEFIEVNSASLTEISEMIMKDKIQDAKTICLFFKLTQYFSEKSTEKIHKME